MSHDFIVIYRFPAAAVQVPLRDALKPSLAARRKHPVFNALSCTYTEFFKTLDHLFDLKRYKYSN